MFEDVLRNIFLGLAGNSRLQDAALRYGMRFGASRFVAGENLNQAAQVVRRLNRQNMKTTLDVLGEGTVSRERALQYKSAYLRTLEMIRRKQLDSGVSLKLTGLGLDLDMTFCHENTRQIVRRAAETGTFVRIDMEDSSHLPATLSIFRALRRDYENVGTVIQAYLYRSEADVLDLGNENSNLRLVKGAYKEPPRIAYPNKQDVDRNFRKLIALHLGRGCFTAIATHDESIIGWSLEWIKRNGIPKKLYEFQFLYGIRPAMQRQMASSGHPVRIYVPYGRSWYPYFMRRLAERPANLGFVIRNLLRT